MAHDGLGLDMKISEHLIRLPTAEETDAIRVNVSAEKGHGACGTQGPGRDVLRAKAVFETKDGNRETEEVG